jgi:hypothetical protein
MGGNEIMGKPARRHHYVPQGYLAGFTDRGTRDGQLFVYDLARHLCSPTRPRNVAFERDFNRIEVAGQDPDALERAFGEFEDRAISVIRGIQARDELPADEEFSFVINLMALFVARNPRNRGIMNQAEDHTVRVIGDMLASDKQLYEHHMARAKADGFVPQDCEVSFEAMQQFIRDNQYKVVVPTHTSLVRELRAAEEAVQYLAARSWTLVTAATDAPDFITCDHPVVITFRYPNMRSPVGYGLPWTEMCFPLNTRQALLGVFEEPLPERIEAKTKLVAMINRRTVWHANRQVYSKTASLTILDDDGIATIQLPVADCR